MLELSTPPMLLGEVQLLSAASRVQIEGATCGPCVFETKLLQRCDPPTPTNTPASQWMGSHPGLCLA